jgi:hypothetical protein
MTTFGLFLRGIYVQIYIKSGTNTGIISGPLPLLSLPPPTLSGLTVYWWGNPPPYTTLSPSRTSAIFKIFTNIIIFSYFLTKGGNHKRMKLCMSIHSSLYYTHNCKILMSIWDLDQREMLGWKKHNFFISFIDMTRVQFFFLKNIDFIILKWFSLILLQKSYYEKV